MALMTSPLPEDAVSSPFFLHPDDNLGVVFVTYPLISENDHSRSLSMVIALFVKNKLGFVDRTLPKPSDPIDPMLPLWL